MKLLENPQKSHFDQMQFLDQNDQLLELQLLDKNIEKCQLLEFKKDESTSTAVRFKKSWKVWNFYILLSLKIVCQLLNTVKQLHFFSSTARNWHVEHVRHTFFCRADNVFLLSNDIFEKSVEIRADAFRAVDPDSCRNTIVRLIALIEFNWLFSRIRWFR